MTVQLKFSINCIVDIPDLVRSIEIISVMNANGEDVTSDFISFCAEKDLPLQSEAEVERAGLVFSREV